MELLLITAKRVLNNICLLFSLLLIGLATHLFSPKWHYAMILTTVLASTVASYSGMGLTFFCDRVRD